MKHQNLEPGERFGRLVIVKRIATTDGRAHYQFRCDCGSLHEARFSHVKSGKIVSCGCFWEDTVLPLAHAASTTHGMTGTPEFKTWDSMLQRCTNPNHHAWSRYGGRGIKVCKRWLHFENFYSDMEPKPNGLTLERINNDGDYKPSNCKWATMKEQAANKRSAWPARRARSAER